MFTATDFYERDAQTVQRSAHPILSTERDRQDFQRGITFARTSDRGEFDCELAAAICLVVMENRTEWI